VDLDLRIEGDDLIGEVRDYGPGFNARAAVLPGKLFGSSKSEGMGVGLALSHATIERLDGEMWMRPAQGPAAASASACRWPHARNPMTFTFHPGPAGRRRPLYLRTLQRSPARKGLETQTAQDAASALALARQHRRRSR
jgi:hypothetical protein